MTKDRSKKPLPESRGLSEAQLDEAIEETFPASDPSVLSPTSVGGPNRSPSRDDRKRGKPPEAPR